MTLQLYLEGKLFNEMHLDEDEFLTNGDLNWEDNVRVKKEMLDVHISQLKFLFWRQISFVKNWEIILRCESKMNYVDVLGEERSGLAVR